MDTEISTDNVGRISNNTGVLKIVWVNRELSCKVKLSIYWSEW